MVSNWRKRSIEVHPDPSVTLLPWLAPLKSHPVFHALASRDSTSAFQGIGETISLKILLEDNQFQQQLSHLGAGLTVSKRVVGLKRSFHLLPVQSQGMVNQSK